MRTTEITGGDATETLLTSSIPDLKLESLAININSTVVHSSTYGILRMFRESAPAKTSHKAGFTHITFTDHANFEQFWFHYYSFQIYFTI